MPSESLYTAAVARLLDERDDDAHRLVDMELVIVGNGSPIFSVGGRWDRRDAQYVGPADHGAVVELSPAQIVAFSWVARWASCYQSGDWSGMSRAWSALFFGGRRAGKSHLACVGLVLFALLRPGSRIFAVSPTLDHTDELRECLSSIIPGEWARFRDTPTLTFVFRNGSSIVLRSGHRPSKLKTGRVDFALYNEAQMMSRKGYEFLRGAAADNGGLVLMAANPPDEPIGLWVEEYHQGVQASKIQGVSFFFDRRLNPHVESASLEALKHEMDERSFLRDIEGQFVPLGNVVFHAFSDQSVREIPAHFEECTTLVSKRLFGRRADTVIGADFDKVPHLAAAAIRCFRDPAHPDEVFLWIVAEFVVEESDEDGLCAALLSASSIGHRADKGRPTLLEKKTALVVGDASGSWQSTDRAAKRKSFDILKSHGLRVVKPDRKLERNPLIVERVRAANAALKAFSGKRRLFFLPTCTQAIHAFKKWENRNGAPHRKSEFAHICDAITYPVWRAFGRVTGKRKASGYTSVKASDRMGRV